MKHGRFSMRLIVVMMMFAVVMCAGQLVMAQPDIAKQVTASPGPGEEKPKPLGLKATTPLVSLGGKTYTTDDVKGMLKYHRSAGSMPLSPDMLTSMTRQQLERPLTDLFSDVALYDKAMKAGFKPEQRTLDGLKQLEDRILSQTLYQKEIVDKIPEVSEAEAKAEYEKNKDTYKTDFSFQVKQIVLYTYKKYTAQEGDTLESIAQKISESESAARNIRDAGTKEERWVAPADRDEKAFRPLREGEELLVPMPPNQAQMVNEKMLDILSELQEGAKFDDLAKKYSEGPNPGEPLPRITPVKEAKPPLDEIVNAVKETPVGKFSDVIRTKHGYQILYVVDKTEEAIKPFDSFKVGLTRQLTAARRLKAGDEYLENLVFKSNYAKLHPEVLTDTKATSAAVVAEIGDLRYTLGDLEGSFGEQLEKATTANDKLKLLAKDRRVISAIVPMKARELGLDKDEAFKKDMEIRRTGAVAFDYLQSETDKQIKTTDADLLKYYQDNIKDYTTPRKYKISQILRNISDNMTAITEDEKKAKIAELTKQLNEVRAKIKSKDDFAKFASELSDDPGTKASGGELKLDVTDTFKQGFDGRLPKMKVGDVSEPFVYGAFVYLIRVNEIQDERVSPFSEVKGGVEAALRRTKKKDLGDELKKKALEEAGFKILV